MEDVVLTLSKEQSAAFHRLTAIKWRHVTRVIYGGQAGGGKSFLICLWLIHMAERYPGTRYYMARERLKDIKESVLLTFWDVIKYTGSKIHYNDNKSVITFSNRSQIYLVDCFAYPADPNFDSMGSREYTAGAIEEGITVTKRAADILISRTRYKHDWCWTCNGSGKIEFDNCHVCNGSGRLTDEQMLTHGLAPKQLITCNPGDGWIKDHIVIPSLEGRLTRKNDVFIRATLESNPNKQFREAYEKTLIENLTEFDRARLLHGDWNAKPKTGAEFLKAFDQKKHIAKCTYDADLPLHITFDENVNPYITCEIWQIQRLYGKRYAVQLTEICKPPPNNSREKVCKEILSRFPKHRGGVFIYGDATSEKNETGKEYGENFFTDILLYLKELRPTKKVPSKNPPVVSKGAFMNLILEKEWGDIVIQIDPSCKLSISDYAYTIEDSDGTILKKRVTNPDTGVSYEKNGHHVDAASYFLCEAFLSDFTRYLSGGSVSKYEVGTDREYSFNR